MTDPDSVEKVQNDEDDKIEHSLLKDNLQEIAMPDSMWKFIKNTHWLIIPKEQFDFISLRDCVNPFISETISYAKVPKDTQSYNNVQAINPKNGKNLTYKIDHVGGYDPERRYVSINHKGQYVKEIRYITKEIWTS